MSRGTARVLLGRIHGLFGVRGWVKIYSYTVPVENILDYPLWHVGRDDDWRPVRLVDGRRHGKGLVALLAPQNEDGNGEPVADRDAAAAFVGCDVAVPREHLPPPPPGQHYWADLIGLRVTGRNGADLGAVDHVLDTGAHGVLVVSGERERLIPLVRGPIVEMVDLDAGRITVDWNPEW